MPITSSAKKALRASNRKRAFNIRAAQTFKDAVKAVKRAGTSGEAEALLAKAVQAIDKATKRGIIKRGNADRTKSRLVRSLRAKAK